MYLILYTQLPTTQLVYLQYSDLLSSHSFRVGFVTKHLKHADNQVVANPVGHKHIATTLNYNRYVVDEKKQREILDQGY